MIETPVTAGQNQTIDPENATQHHGLDQQMTRMTPDQKKLVSKHIGLVGLHIRNNVPTTFEPKRKREYHDLFQEGCLALIKAATRYDEKKDGDFVAYALPRIRGTVHQAIHDKFSLIRVPFRVMLNLRQTRNDGVLDPLRRPILSLNKDIPIEVPLESNFDQKNETVKHMIRRRFEWAVNKALIETKSLKRRRPDFAQIMHRIANERLLISREGHKTAQRRIAHNYGLPCSRASLYERRFFERIKQIFQNDAQIHMLVRFARQERDGFNAILDDQQYRQLSQVQIDQFTSRFERMGKSQRAEVLYSLIERSADNILDVARNLYRLTTPTEPDSANLN
ncbi:MAG: sigma-70 family RNA polymerase sigma factor [Planctomycetota bacterium]|jgi:RNA polymerase sigma factor (sigma-70 family)